MSRFKVTATSEGMKVMIQDWNNLTKEQQKAIQQMLLADKGLKKVSKNSALMKKLKTDIKDVGKAFLGMVGANGATQLFGTIIERAKKNMEQIVELQNKASQGQRTVSQSLRGLIANDKDLSKDENKIQGFLNFSAEQGQKLGEGGQAQVLDALKDLRSATDGTDEQRKQALREAVSLKEFDANTDLSAAAKSIFNVTRSLEKLNDPNLQGKDLNKVAVGFIKTLGAQFTGDASNALKQVTTLLTKSNLDVDSSQASALFSFISKAIDDPEGKQSASTTGDLLTKILTADGKKIGGKALKFSSTGGFDRLLEFSERLKSGEFGNTAADKAKAIKTVFGEGQNTVTSVLALSEAGAIKGLKNNVGSFKDSFAGVDIVGRDKRIASQFVGTDLIEESKKRAGQRDRVLNQRTDLAAFSERAKQLQDIQETLGVTDGFDFLKDWRQLINRNTGDADSFFKAELAKLFNNAGIATSVTYNEATGLGGVYNSVTRDTALGTEIKSGSDLDTVARRAIELNKVDLSDGLNQVEQAILVWAGLGEQMIQKLKEDKASRDEIMKALQNVTPAVTQVGEND